MRLAVSLRGHEVVANEVKEKQVMNKFLVVLSAMAILTIMMDSVSTAELYGTVGAGRGTNSTLVELDPATGGLIRTIGAVGYTVNGLSYDPVGKKMYGSTAGHDPVHNGLIEIDLGTGAGTPIGASGWGLGGASVTNIAVNSAGAMFGWWDPSMDDLVSIDKTTGIATLVGESGIGTGGNGLAFNGSGQLFMFQSSSTYAIDTSTGAATWLGDVGGFPGGYGGYLHHGDFDPGTDHYYGISDAWSNPRAIYVVDVSTLSIVETLPTIDSLHTLAFMTEGVVPVPAAAILAVIGMGFASNELRRRRLS